jgi:thioredoxin-related protein
MAHFLSLDSLDTMIEETIRRGPVMRRIHTRIAAALAVVAMGFVMNTEAQAQSGEGAAFAWRSVSEALEQAPTAEKLILVDVYTDWCGWCKRMDRDTYADSSVGAYIAERFIAAKMNPEKSGTVKYDGKEFSQAEFGQALGVNGYPATAFFTSKGELITVVPGYLPAGDFRLLLQFLADEHYKTQAWDDYKNANS